MASSTARGKAAQAWCKPETETEILDDVLCEAFAKILDEPVIKVRDKLLKAIEEELGKADHKDGYQSRVHELVLSFAIISDRV